MQTIIIIWLYLAGTLLAREFVDHRPPPAARGVAIIRSIFVIAWPAAILVAMVYTAFYTCRDWLNDR